MNLAGKEMCEVEAFRYGEWCLEAGCFCCLFRDGKRGVRCITCDRPVLSLRLVFGQVGYVFEGKTVEGEVQLENVCQKTEVPIGAREF